MRWFVRSTFCVALALASMTAPGLAAADEPTPADRTLARTLFEEGRALLKDGKFAEACPKLEESERLAPGMGTLFNLADCFENLGRTASSWAAFSEVADLAKRAGQTDRETVARERAAALKPKLVYWKLHLAGAAPTGLTLRIDDRAVSNAVLDAELPVDPGLHRVKVMAPGKVEHETEVRIETTTPMTPVELPALLDAPQEPAPLAPAPKVEPPPEPPVVPEAERTWQKPTALVAGGVALVALGVGTAFGLKASSQWSDAKATCNGNVCDKAGYAGWQDSRSSATVSTVFFTTGAVVATAAVVLWLTAPNAREARTSLGRVSQWGTF